MEEESLTRYPSIDKPYAEEAINAPLHESDLEETVTVPADVLGQSKQSILFYPMFKLLSPLLSCDPKKIISQSRIRFRKFLHPFFMLFVPAFMGCKQKFESPNALLGINTPDKLPELPKESVIWCVNHGFKDDIAATIHATRHSYIFFGALPLFLTPSTALRCF